MIKFSIIFLSSCLFTYTLTESYPGYYWRDYRRVMPEDAFQADTGLYLGQVHSPSGILPATFYPIGVVAYATCYGRLLVVKNAIKLLCDDYTKRFYWEYANINKIKSEELDDLVIGGMENDTTLYVGKIFHEGEWRIGKVYPADHTKKGLTVWSNDENACIFQDFQILKYNENITDIYGYK